MATPSHNPGMGAIVFPGGATFRVWAPNAQQVFVIGSFNGWDENATPLAHEANGYWSADVAGARIGDEYKYLIVNGAQRLQRTDPYARQLTSSIGNSLITSREYDWGDDHFELPPFNELVLYEIHIGTFYTKVPGAPGDFYAAAEKMPYLKALGINAIEVMPPMEFPGAFSWGYNPAHLFALQAEYGGVKGFKELVRAAHANNIGVILDVVYNHLGPHDLGLWRFDGWSENDLGGIYFYNDWRAKTPWGHTRPDYGRSEVRQYLRDNVLMWLDEYHVDGLRWDSTLYIRTATGNDLDPNDHIPEGWAFMQAISAELATRGKRILTIAEDLHDDPALVRPLAEGGAGFSAQWDIRFIDFIRPAIISPDDDSRDVHAIRDALAHRYADDGFRRIVYTESHDEVANGRARIPEMIWPGKVSSWYSKKRSTLGVALCLTAPGIPMLFQGQEFLEDRWFEETDPLDWTRADKYSGLVDLHRRLIHLRLNRDGTTCGLVGQNIAAHHVNNETKVLAYHRWENGGPQDSVIVVVNLANQSHAAYAIGLPRAGKWRVRFNSDSNLYDPTFQNFKSDDVLAVEAEYDGLPAKGEIGIGAYSVVILSQDE